MSDAESRTADDLIARFTNRSATVAVVGLGYVGLPLAVRFAESGYNVFGVDYSDAVVDLLNTGKSHIEDIPHEAVDAQLTAGRFRATTDYAHLAECHAVSICVPTPLSKSGNPDTSYIVAATQAVAEHLRPGTVVVLESTTYPTTTRDLVGQILLETHPHLVIGENLFLAFSPERVDPGREDWTTKNTPKILGGITPVCLDAASAFYGAAVDTLIKVSSPEVAETAKLFENTFRAVNIALVNELLFMCEKLEIPVWEVLDAAATKPFGFMPFRPGPGLGGHCIPIDPLYLAWKARSVGHESRFIELADSINSRMPGYWVRKVQDALNDHEKAANGSVVLVLGVAYKPNISDVRESPSLDIIEGLQEVRADVRYHDPYVPSIDIDGISMTSETDLDAAIDAADCVVIATDHQDYDWSSISDRAPCIVDTRGVLHRKRLA